MERNLSTKTDSLQAGPLEPARSGKIVEALARGLRILSLFSDDEPWLGLSEIARRTNLTTATALRLLRTLQQLDFVEQSMETKKYRPSLAVLRLGFAALSGQGLRDVALPHLQRLAAKIGETVNLVVLASSDVVYIERVALTQLITANIHVGSRLPAYSTSTGKVLMAYLDSQRRRELLDTMSLAKSGPNTITDQETLEHEFERIRQFEYAVQDEELVVGLRSIAVPIRDRTGDVVAAINAAVPAVRVSVNELETTILPVLQETAVSIASALGYAGVGRTDASDLAKSVSRQGFDG